ncbi:enhancer of mRNA-decapping protein 4-like [Magnolia sinica]|uniref:enhancer of mRNA-decapping protein 4-like n=1 Tax=Magnolia sinica TaxID=86752 RepID=UPI002659BA6A|nr:enhancer of mRNA-decapping protein 4-like [Magnolia sinica]
MSSFFNVKFRLTLTIGGSVASTMSIVELMTILKEMQKQMTDLVTVPVNKEGSRVEAALGLSMEKSLKSNCDALRNCNQEENKKQKLERDRMKQITSSISGSMNTKCSSMFKNTLKQEIAAIGPAGSRAITPILEKTVSSAIADSFQRGVGNNAVNQLEKSVNSNLEATVTRQIQAQFQTSGKQVFQLACDIGNNTSQKLDWMVDVVVAIDPVDPTIVAHGRPIFEQVHQILDHQRVLPTTTTAERSSIRLIMCAINSVLKTCK